MGSGPPPGWLGRAPKRGRGLTEATAPPSRGTQREVQAKLPLPPALPVANSLGVTKAGAMAPHPRGPLPKGVKNYEFMRSSGKPDGMSSQVGGHPGTGSEILKAPSGFYWAEDSWAVGGERQRVLASGMLSKQRE